jgi:hypothetical protein
VSNWQQIYGKANDRQNACTRCQMIAWKGRNCARFTHLRPKNCGAESTNQARQVAFPTFQKQQNCHQFISKKEKIAQLDAKLGHMQIRGSNGSKIGARAKSRHQRASTRARRKNKTKKKVYTKLRQYQIFRAKKGETLRMWPQNPSYRAQKINRAKEKNKRQQKNFKIGKNKFGKI